MKYLQMWNFKVLTSAFLVLSLLLAVACGAAATATPAAKPATPAPAAAAVPQAPAVPNPINVQPVVHPGKVTVMVGGWGGRFAPAHGTNCHVYDVNMHGYLIRSRDHDRSFIPSVATRWEISADGKTWTITIRDGVAFHDGRPLTIEDVYFTWLQSWGPNSLNFSTSSSALNMARNTEKIELVSANQVSITHKKPDVGFAGFISDTSGACQGMVLPRHLWGLDPLSKLHDAALMEAYDRNPVAAGPMKMVKHTTEELMAFERYDQYFDIERMLPMRSYDLRKVPEEATRAAALRAGEADIAPVSQATRNQVEAGGGRIIFGQEATYLFIRHMGAWTKAPHNIKEVRQALAYAIDLKTLQNQLWGTDIHSPRGWLYVSPSAIGYSSELDPFPYDPEKARQLLAKAGYPSGQGYPKIKLNTWPSRAVPNMPEAAQLVADYWKRELGLNVEVYVGDETALKRITNAGVEAYGELLLRENETSVESTSSFRSAYFTADNPGRRHNDPEIFDQAAKAISVFEPAERIKVWNQLHRRLRDDAYEISLGYVNAPWGVGPRILDWKPQPMAFYPSALHTIVLK